MKTVLRTMASLFPLMAVLHCNVTLAVMTSDDLVLLKQPAPGIVIPYGPDALQFGELNLPAGAGPHPVIVWIHGGCWLSEWDMTHSRMTARAFADHGYAVWNLEYRRVGNPDGGWPGTFLDVANGADQVRALAEQYPLDVSRVIVGGHSAGGHLALWLAARAKIAPVSDIHGKNPLRVNGVLALAPAPQLEALHEKSVCDGVVNELMGGAPETIPERYASASPARMALLGVPQVIVLGSHDDAWLWVGRDYIRSAQSAGDRQIRVIEATDSGHFEMIYPGSSSWPVVVEAARSLLN